MSLKTNDTKREYMDSLFVKCLKKSWKWLVQSDLKEQTEATICAAQEQALRTNYKKNKVLI